MSAVPNNRLPQDFSKRTELAALFSDPVAAERTVNELSQAGFTGDQIGVVARDRERWNEPAERAATKLKVPEGETGARFWDRVARFFSTKHETAEGELRSMLGEMDIPESQIERFENRIDDGDIMVTVHAGARGKQAAEIMRRNGGDFGTMATSKPVPVPRPGLETGPRRIQLLGEALRIHKERVQRGEVRVRKEVVTETQNLQVPVSHEEVVIERRDVSGEAPRGNIGSGGEIRVPLSEEQVRVEKRPVVTGEVDVSKRNVEETRHVTDKIRHEEPRVEKQGDVRAEEKNVIEKTKKPDRAA